ncbi:DUF262 domain-containing protein [Porphyromonas endodontalis]|uniref:DUF262 domain-containing protein n=2 Tax=Porphyromonas endodontalis TaxID=28124 RepID=UPI003C7AC2B0
MATSIQVNRQNVVELLKTGVEHPFIIPEYQRPYAWSIDEVKTLFDDLWEFTISTGGSSNASKSYFLGTIVSFINEDGEQEIIDGQQRITTLFLFLRAIFTHLFNSDNQTDESKHFISMIAPAIWKTNKLTGKIDFKQILLMSKVINNEGNEILRGILETGEANPRSKDNYSINYLRLQELFKEKASSDPLQIYDFIYAILNQAIILPITAEDQEMALTIFSTLNDRGLPLSDADIFKAKIYNHLPSEEKKEFIERWKDLDQECSLIGESIQSLFTYYMFHVRATEGDAKTTIPGIRKYFIENKCARLYKDNLLDDLYSLLGLRRVIKKATPIDGESWSVNPRILKMLNLLSFYPNEFAKYPINTFYLIHHKTATFEYDFEVFVKRLTRDLILRFILQPSVNAVKPMVVKTNVAIVGSPRPAFEDFVYDKESVKSLITIPHTKITRMLLLMIAYEQQDDLLPSPWEIEHIIPQKWHANYFEDVPEEEIKQKIEHIGNKVPFEKALNIIAGNGYFTKKQKEYQNSKIVITKQLGDISCNDWCLLDIEKRDNEVIQQLMSIFDRWKQEYDNTKMSKPSLLDEEETIIIEKIKEDKALLEQIKGMLKY